MKTKKLLQAIGDIRPDYIEAALKHGVTEAESAADFVPETEPAPQRRTALHRILTAASLAACTALVIGCGIWIHHAGSAARENSGLTNLKAEHTVEIEPATTAPGQSADETVSTETKASPNGSDAAVTDPGTQPEQNDTQTLLSVTIVSAGSTEAQLTQTAEQSSGNAQSAQEKSETTKSSTSEPQKYSIDVRVIKSFTYSDKLKNVPAAYVMHSLEDIWFMPDDGSPLSAIQSAFHADDSLRDWRTEEFFRQNDLILSGLMLGSGSYELGLRRLTVTESGRGDPPKIRLNQLLYEPDVTDCAMCGYFMAIRVPKGLIEGYPETAADVQYIKPDHDPVTGRMTDDRLDFWRESCKEELCFAIED